MISLRITKNFTFSIIFHLIGCFQKYPNMYFHPWKPSYETLRPLSLEVTRCNTRSKNCLFWWEIDRYSSCCSPWGSITIWDWITNISLTNKWLWNWCCWNDGGQAVRKNIPILLDAEKKRDGLDEILVRATYAVCAAKFPQVMPSISDRSNFGEDKLLTLSFKQV